MRRLRRHAALVLIVLLALSIVAIQVWATVRNARRVEEIVTQLKEIEVEQLPDEKARQEVISLRVENEMRAFFWNSLLSTLGPMITAFVALLGSLLGLRNYLETRDRERLDRAAVELKDLLERLVSEEPRERAVGVVGLQHFLTPDKEEYHLRALSALVTTARLEDDQEVLRGLRIAAEQAVKALPADVLGQVTWQGVKLRGADFSGSSLRNLDLRDADLEDADLRRCDLSGASLTNARLNGAKLDECVLRGADLAYADLAGASLARADLQQAELHHIKVWRMDLDGADLRGAQFDPDQVPWELVSNWRTAVYDAGLLDRLLGRYGPAPRGTRALMLMWEVPPLVAGGTWTASYHLVRNLRQRGADLTVVVPWDEPSILPSPFGCEVDVIPLGIAPPREAASPYAAWGEPSPWSPYASTGYRRRYTESPYAPSGYPGDYWSPYAPSRFRRDTWSPYGSPGLYSPYFGSPGPYWGRVPSSYARPEEDRTSLRAGSTLLRLIDEYSKRVLRYAEREAFDVIHAHDWVTFDAADAAARRAGKPWVAHFHSTERDRRPSLPDPIIGRIERQGALAADHIVVPSETTSRRVQELYDVPASKITVVPNPLSWEEVAPSEMGSFETKRTIFLGRLTAQKGPDHFARVATEVRRRHREAAFWVFGEGEEAPDLRYHPDVSLRGVVEWSVRGSAFSNATAVLVPSRYEPFGMVVLEAMQHRVPVLYPQSSGAAEVIESGFRIRPDDVKATAEELERLLTDWRYWEEAVQKQSREIAGYPDRGYEQRVLELWETLNARVDRA
jgi:glycosyltransferase involved in cell wall biosynthesis